MLTSPRTVTTVDADTFFYLPLFPSYWRGAVRSLPEAFDLVLQNALQQLSALSPNGSSFKARDGRHHLYENGHDIAKPFGKTLLNMTRSSALVNSAEIPERKCTSSIHCRFNPRLDVSLPCNANVKMSQWASHANLSADTPRSYVVFYAGDIVNSMRKRMVTSFQGIPNTRIFVRRYTASTTAHHISPQRYMPHSDFCLCPRGNAVWSPRLMEAIWFACIPVIVADNYWLPQGCFWDWKEMSLMIPENRSSDVAHIVLQFAVKKQWVIKARRALLRVRGFFMWHAPRATPGDAFEMTMLEAMLKQDWCAQLL